MNVETSSPPLVPRRWRLSVVGLVLLVLVLASALIFVVISVTRIPTAEARERALVLRGIDEYENWRKADPQAGELKFAGGWNSYFAGVTAFGERRPEFRAYFLWYVDSMVVASNQGPNMAPYVRDSVVLRLTAADLRRSEYLDRYFAERR